ncbi:MAG: HAD family hydrolase, partial [Actinomycetota bacterium]|nr:HAD family hydrolase [Actinomycetota bacterium]
DHSGRLLLTSIARQIGSTVARAIEWNMVTQGLLVTDLNGISASTALRNIPGAVMQPEEWQPRSNQSHVVEDRAKVQLTEIRDELEERDSEAGGDCSAGKFLDLLPPRSVRAGAVRSPVESLGIDPGIVIIADDTSNGLDMMHSDLGFRSIAIGVTGPERREGRVPNVRHASAPFSNGVQQGLHHHGWLLEEAACNGTGTSTTKSCSHGHD